MINVQVNPAPVSLVNNEIVISIGAQGSQGAPGRGIPVGGDTGQLLAKASDANYDTNWVDAQSVNNISDIVVCGDVISALRLVYTDPVTAKVLYADKDIPDTVNSLLGVSTQAGILDENINVLISGVLQDSSWNWNMTGDVNLFLGANGAIVQGAPIAEVIVRIGYAISTTKIMVRIGDFILTA